MKARIPKDMTRMTPDLLRSAQEKGIETVNRKTHFEQVPLEVVKKIVEKQIGEQELNTPMQRPEHDIGENKFEKSKRK